VVLFHIYSRERHPQEPGYQEYHHTGSDEEKMAYARIWKRRTVLPVAVDGIDEKVLTAYGRVPNAAFVLDRQGRFVFQAKWADADKVEAVIDRLLEHGEKS
jgi:hypothetical protein